MKNSKISKKAKTFLDGLQKYRDGGMQVPLPEYQDGVLAPMAPDPNWINYDPSLIQGPELFAYPNQNPMSIQPPMAINPPIQNPIPTPKPKPNFNAIPVIGSAITLGMGIKEGVESYQAKKRSDRLRGYFDQDLAERKKDISLGEYVNTPYSQYQDGGIKLGERVSNFRATDSSQSGTTAGADKMEKAKLSAAQQKENQRILAERKARMERSKAAKGKPISAQQIADESAAIGDKFRVFPDDPNSVVDALNPLVMIGDMAAGLGQVPLNIQEGNYGQAAMNVSMPLLAGALAGGKNAAQLANNLINPLAGTGEFLTTQTPLRNVYKYNPFAIKENPEMFLYRTQPKDFVAGYTEEQFLKDLIADKTLKGEKVPFYLKGKLDQIKYNPEPFRKALDDYHGQWFDKNPERMDFYMKGRLDGDEGNILRLKVNKEEGQSYNLKNFPEAQKASLNYDTEFIVPKDKIKQAEVFSTNDWQKLIQEDNTFNRPNWLRGYKKVPKQLSNFSKFKSEIDWSKWNADTPKFPELINEYNAIEESTKKAGTWMKNPDGSDFQGSPEQFIQQQSSWFKKAFPNILRDSKGNVLPVKHGSPNKFEEFKKDYFASTTDMGDKGVGTYVSPLNYAKEYGDNIYELAVNSKNPLYASNFIPDDIPLSARQRFADSQLKWFHRDVTPKLEGKINRFLDNDLIIGDEFHPKINENSFEMVVPYSNRMKSLRNNVGFFDMSNPNIYKSLLPAAAAVGASQKMQEVEELPRAKEGGIHIDPKNKGKFTAAAKRRGMGVQEFANKVMANKEDYSPLLVKRANFARNAAKWEDGGMYPTVSSDYNTTVELANQRQAQAMDLLQKMQEVEELHKMMYGGEIEEFKGGGEMIKRADGSYSRVGLWDRIRANRGSGKKPTKEMLEQERKIRREEMEYGGYMPFMDSMDENNQYMDLPEFGNGGYKVERSNDRKGKTHKVTGPDGSVKYFGDPNMGERSKSKYGKEAFYARHKSNLEKNPHFRAYARATWQNGGQVGLEGFGQMYDNQQAYNQQTQQQFEDFYNRLNQQNVANWRNMRTSAINNIVSGVGGLATAGMGLPGMQSGGEYDPTLDVNSTQFDADAFMGREKGQPSELDALIEAEQAKQMQRSETEMELMNFITEGADTGQANYSNLGMFANNPSSGLSSSSLAGAGEFANVIDEIRYRESRGNYGRVNDVSQTTGAYQFMPKYWADQIQDFMGIDPSASQEEVMEAFRTNPQAQDEFMVHVVNNIYKPQLPKLRPYAQKYGLNDDQLIKLMHYRGVGDAIKRLKTGDFSVSAEEKAKYNNPDIMEYLKGSIPK